MVLGVRDAFEAIKDEFKDALAAEKDQVCSHRFRSTFVTMAAGERAYIRVCYIGLRTSATFDYIAVRTHTEPLTIRVPEGAGSCLARLTVVCVSCGCVMV